MANRRARLVFCATLIQGILSATCSAPKTGKVCTVLKTSGENDKRFNNYTLRGASQETQEYGLDFAHAFVAFAYGQLESGRRQLILATGRVCLVPYFKWEEQILCECKAAVEEASASFVDGTIDTGFGR